MSLQLDPANTVFIPTQVITQVTLTPRTDGSCSLSQIIQLRTNFAAEVPQFERSVIAPRDDAGVVQ